MLVLKTFKVQKKFLVQKNLSPKYFSSEKKINLKKFGSKKIESGKKHQGLKDSVHLMLDGTPPIVVNR